MWTGPPEKGDLWSRTCRTRVPFECLLTDQSCICTRDSRSYDAVFLLSTVCRGSGTVFSHMAHTRARACTRCFLYRSAGRVTWPVYNYAQCNMLSMIVLFLRPSFFKWLQIFDYSAHFLIIVKFLPAFDPGSLSVRLSVDWRWASLDVSINQSLIQI